MHGRDRHIYLEKLSELRSQVNYKIENLIAYSQWILWYACTRSALIHQYAIDNLFVENDEYNKACTTGAGFGEINGFVNTAYSYFSSENVGILKIREQFSHITAPTDSQLMDAYYLYYMMNADLAEEQNNKFQLLLCLYEAKSALTYSTAFYGWDSGRDHLIESIELGSTNTASVQARKKLAQSAARARHSASIEAKDCVRTRYAEERGKYQSKDHAALAYTKEYAFEFSTIRDWLKGA